MYKLDLLPVELQKDFSIDIKGLVRRVTITVAVILIFTSYGFFLYMGYLNKKEIADTERYLKQISSAVQKVEAIKAQRVTDEERLKAYQELLGDRLTWYPLLEDLKYNIPADMWLENIYLYYVTPHDKPDINMQRQPVTAAQVQDQATAGRNMPDSSPPPNTLALVGYASSIPSIGFFTNNLYRMPYFSSVVLNEYRWEQQKECYKFDLTATLKEGGG